MKRSLQFLWVLVSLVSWGELSRVEAAAPNVVLVLIDDMGYGDLGCYGGSAQTPNMDRLAAEGVRFTQYYSAAPICSPSRCGILTGQRPERWRIISYLESREMNEKRGMAQWLDPQAPSLARALKTAGYRTGHFGKWHLGGQRDVGDAPMIQEYGFDASLTQFEGLGDRVLAVMGGFDGRPSQKMKLGLGSEKLGRGNIEWLPRHEVTGRFVARAIEFIQEGRAQAKPFYINVWPDDVHSPFSPPPGAAGDGSKKALYRGVLENMDRQLGRLFDFIRADEALRGNTLVLLASDNGAEPGAGSSGRLRGGKALLYEGGVRSPLIAWGGPLEPKAKGKVNDQAVLSALDLAPSILALAGATRPATWDMDGEDRSAVLRSCEGEGRKTPLMWRRPPDRRMMDQIINPDFAIRDGRWKFYMDADGGNACLYDLSTDLEETRDVKAQHPAEAERLAAMLKAWQKTLPPLK